MTICTIADGIIQGQVCEVCGAPATSSHAFNLAANFPSGYTGGPKFGPMQFFCAAHSPVSWSTSAVDTGDPTNRQDVDDASTDGAPLSDAEYDRALAKRLAAPRATSGSYDPGSTTETDEPILSDAELRHVLDLAHEALARRAVARRLRETFSRVCLKCQGEGYLYADDTALGDIARSATVIYCDVCDGVGRVP